MKRASRICLFASVLALCGCLFCFGQGKMYTRRYRLEDFPTKTTKVVISGHGFLELALREEITSRWRISPYEFCTSEEYSSIKSDNNFYFLLLGEEEGVAFLILSKGGREEEQNNLLKPFEVVRMPIASIGDPSGKELMFMGAFIDILQAFVEDAMLSDNAAYSGLDWYNGRKLEGKNVYLDHTEADEHYLNNDEKAIVGICIAPTTIASGSKCYKMLVSADTHELYFYKEAKYKGTKDTTFTENEKRKFEKLNGIVVR